MPDATYSQGTYRPHGGNEQVIASGGVLRVESGGIPVGLALQRRVRATIAQINAGLTLLPALPGYGYRLTDAVLIAIGGNVTTVTTVDIKAAAVILLAAAAAQLTRSTVLRAGAAGATVLADGASFVVQPANTAITVIKAGADITVASDVDVLLAYMVEAA